MSVITSTTYYLIFVLIDIKIISIFYDIYFI